MWIYLKNNWVLFILKTSGSSGSPCMNNQLHATIITLLIISISSTCFGKLFRPSSGALDGVYCLWYSAQMMLPAGDQNEVDCLVCRSIYSCIPDSTPHPCHQQAASPVHYTTSCKHSLALLRMGEIIARNMLSWLKLLISCYCCN